MKKLYLLCLVACTLPGVRSQAQDLDSLFALSLDELMNISIESASKKKESLFEAPLSSYIITGTEIERSGANSIPEALRLAPGVIVREQTNGVYDVQIRGLDNLSRFDVAIAQSNLSTLVMIDNRPVFNHNLGGTFWESLPVDISDVQQIEVVRGPSAPLFGPNAVTGVINILTKRTREKKTQVAARGLGGSLNSAIASAFVGHRFSEKLNVNVSANYQQRQRFDRDYYNTLTNTYAPIAAIYEATNRTNNPVFPDPEQSIMRSGANIFMGYTPSKNVSFDVSVGTQASEAQKSFVSNYPTAFSWNQTQSTYANVAAKIHGLSIRTSYWRGNEDLSKNAPPSSYSFAVSDLLAEYTFKIGKVGTIVPGISYTDATFDDRDNAPSNPGFISSSRTITTSAAFLRTDWMLTKKWRVIAAARVDKFSIPDDSYIAYEFATTYSLNDRNLLRAAITRSNSGSFIGNNYANFIGGPGWPVQGNPNLNLFRVATMELGYRAKLSDHLQVDVDVFRQRADNINAIYLSAITPIPVPPFFIPALVQYQNMPLVATQTGATLSVNYLPTQRLQIKPFITWQRTMAENVPSSLSLPALDPTLSFSNSEHTYTPAFYGGLFMNYKAGERWNFNVSGYFFGEQTIYQVLPRPDFQHDGKLLLNARVSYAAAKAIDIFVSGRNILNDREREFAFTDQIGSFYTAGLSINFER